MPRTVAPVAPADTEAQEGTVALEAVVETGARAGRQRATGRRELREAQEGPTAQVDWPEQGALEAVEERAAMAWVALSTTLGP